MAQTRGRKTSSKRKTNSRRKSGSRTPDRYENTVIDEVLFLISLAVTILLFLCNFHLIGKVGDNLSKVMFGLFGYMAYVAPLLLFFAVYFGISNLGNHVASIKLVSGIIFFSMCCVLFTLTGGIDNIGSSIKNYYGFSAEAHKGGGVLGGFLGKGMHGLLGLAGTIIIMIVLMLVCLVLMTERSFLAGIKRGGKAVLNDVDRRKELARERMEMQAVKREERENIRNTKKKEAEESRLRMNKKASGVASVSQLTLKEEEKPVKAPGPVASVMKDEEGEKLALEALSKIRIRGIDDAKQTQNAGERVFGQEIGQEPITLGKKNTGRNEDVQTAMAKEAEPVQETRTQTAVRTPEVKDNKTETSGKDLDISDDIKAAAKPKKAYKLPPLNLLKKGSSKTGGDSGQKLRETALRLQQTLHTFGVNVTVTDISQGPAVTRYELQPEVGVKVSKIVNLADDIKLNLAATDIRIEAPIPGKAAVGIEVPNSENSAVALRDLLESPEFQNFDSKLAFAVGKDIGGKTVVTDIAKMPHMLIAGSTGSGKSVCINTIIMSLLYKANPDEVKLIMVDPKVVELSVYNGIPHLMIPVVTDPKKAAAALHWGVAEMTERYKKFADFNVRDLKGYNKKVSEMRENNGQPIPEKMPQIVIIVDELADLMMVAPGEVEESICRLAQLARAAGIHLIIATQRPSVDVVTGLIKANIPSRCALMVSSGVDSRTVIDSVGAEKLLGNGDMLFYPSGYVKPVRLQGAFVSDAEVQRVVDFWSSQADGVNYDESISEYVASQPVETSGASANAAENDGRDEYFMDAARFVVEKEKASTSMLQRVFKIGFNRAARIIEQLEEAGIIGEEEGTKPRKVLVTQIELENLIK